MSKKLVNSPETCVDDALRGIVAVNPGLCLLEGHRVVIRKDIDQVKAAGKVTILSGGGSGHEPAHAGYVGPGMLTGAVAGAVFTSPPPSSILAAIRAVGRGSKAGTVLVVKNYTGDRLNFGIAAERAKAEGLEVDMVVVGEDCALTSADKTAGRRGLAGTVLIHKIGGAMAERGCSLKEIVSALRSAADEMGTVGLSLSPCTVPGSGPSFNIGSNEMELGLGIHGEAGVRRMEMATAGEAVDIMLKHMTNPESSTAFRINTGDSLALVVNNLGGTSVLELSIVAKEAIVWLESQGVRVDRVYCGSLITSLEMAGVSLSLMKLNAQRELCLDAFTASPGWVKPLYLPGDTRRTTPANIPAETTNNQASQDHPGKKLDPETAKIFHRAIAYAAEALGNCEKQLNVLDTQSGDGDCGTTFKRGTDAILDRMGPLETTGLPVDCPAALALALAAIVEEHMGGSSGALYSLMLTAASKPLETDTGAPGLCQALGYGIEAVKRYGGAEPGDRTMLDALIPAHLALVSGLQSGTAMDAFAAAVQAAEQGGRDTVGMRAQAGRASYVSADLLTQPDPGAHAIGIWMRAAYEATKLMMSQSTS